MAISIIAGLKLGMNRKKTPAGGGIPGRLVLQVPSLHQPGQSIQYKMRETITIQVGQCGNAIGNKFWTLMLQEHEKTPDEDDSLSSFFRFEPQRDGTAAMKARALLVDMECGPLNETMRGPLGPLFSETQYVMDVYGAGNNFAHGHHVYGPQYRAKFEESLRKSIEHCDSLQTFFVLHSLGGGTGSGVGTYIVSMLEDLYPDVYRFSTCVFPSEDDDVVTSPYNAILASRKLSDHADCIIPLDNHALQSFANLENSKKAKQQELNPNTLQAEKKALSRSTGFNDMNNVAGRMLCHLTSSSRFHGEMNVDMNEICTNLVPFPKLQFLSTCLSPQRPSSIRGSMFGNRGDSSRSALQRAFGDLASKTSYLSAADPFSSTAVSLASAFLARGDVPLSDFLTCVDSARASMRFPRWNPDAAKIGLCSEPSPGEKMAILGIHNSTAFGHVLSRERGRFNLLFKRKAMVHHYTEFVEIDEIKESENVISQVISDYKAVEVGDDSRLPSRRLYDNLAAISLFPSF